MTVMLYIAVVTILSTAVFGKQVPDCLPGLLPIRIPDPEDCASYYVCEAGIGIQLHCRHGQFFNPTTKLCDAESVVFCKGEHGVRMSSVADIGSSVGADSKANKKDPQCPWSSTPVLISDEEDCASYYFCQLGVVVQVHCRHGLFFNPKTQRCDAESVVFCKGGQGMRISIGADIRANVGVDSKTNISL